MTSCPTASVLDSARYGLLTRLQPYSLAIALCTEYLSKKLLRAQSARRVCIFVCLVVIGSSYAVVVQSSAPSSGVPTHTVTCSSKQLIVDELIKRHVSRVSALLPLYLLDRVQIGVMCLIRDAMRQFVYLHLYISGSAPVDISHETKRSTGASHREVSMQIKL